MKDKLLGVIFLCLLIGLIFSAYNTIESDKELHQLQNNLSYVIMLNTDLNQSLNHQNLTVERLKSNISTMTSDIKNYKDIIKYKDELFESKVGIILNPTYATVVQFIKDDRTDERLYINDDFDCTQFTTTVLRNARAKGIMGCFVEINFGVGNGHAIVAFNTSDKGIVYFEPQTDKEVKLKLGINYWYDQLTAKEQFSRSYWCNQDDTYCMQDIVTLYDSCYELVQ